MIHNMDYVKDSSGKSRPRSHIRPSEIIEKSTRLSGEWLSRDLERKVENTKGSKSHTRPRKPKSKKAPD